MQLRFATRGAAAGWADVQRSASPFLVGSEDSVLHDMTHHAETLARCVVVEDGAVLAVNDALGCRPSAVTWSARRRAGA